MARSIAIVEGPHDAAFIGMELRRRGFQQVDKLDEVDEFWRDLIPKVFPAGLRLEHVVRYPDIYSLPGTADSWAVVVAGGDARLLSELRATLEILDGSQLTGICVLADADDHPAAHRYSQLTNGLVALNNQHSPGGTESGTSGLPGFPLDIPAIGDVTKGKLRVGLYVLPDNNGSGTLDQLLLECAQTSFASIFQGSIDFVDATDVAVAADERFKGLRKPSGKKKAAAGVIGNVLFPGSSLSVAIDRGNWDQPLSGGEVSINAFRAFFEQFF